MGLPSLDPFSSSSAQHRIWRGDELGQADSQVVGTGYDVLDAQLPGGGWPVGAMTELLLASPEVHAWQLLLPALAQAVTRGTGPVVLIGAPCEPFGPSLAARGLPLEALLWVRAEADAARSWACEQALRCADVAAVLAWLPHVRGGELRRLQLAAAQHEALLFVLRPDSAAHHTSPARLRLQVASCEEDHARLDIHILKRRGPPLAAPLQLPARSERMTAMLAASRLRRKLRRQQEGELQAAGPAIVQGGATVLRLDLSMPRNHALDRAAA